MRVFSWLTAVFSLVFLAGCIPEKVVWSPDGARAAILASDGLRLCDPDGRIGPVLLADPQRAAWSPDGRRLILVRQAHFTSYHDILNANATAEVDGELAARVRDTFLSTGGDWDRFTAAVSDLPEDQWIRAVIFLRDPDPVFREKIGGSAPRVMALEYAPPCCQIFDLNPDGTHLMPGPLLCYGKHGRSLEVRVAPGGKAVAVVMLSYSDKPGDKSDPMIYIAAMSGHGDPLALGPGCGYPDWSPDGKSLLFIHRNSVDLDDSAGTLLRQRVLTDQGFPLSAKDLPASEELAPVPFFYLTRIRCAADGRIFFNGQDIQRHNSNGDASIFVLNPRKNAAPELAFPRQTQESAGDFVQYFSLSPDDKHLAIPSQHGQVSVVTLATGEVNSVQRTSFEGVEDKDKLDSVPNWRSADELTFVRPAGAKREIVRFSISSQNAISLSAAWPDSATKGWLTSLPAPQVSRPELP